MDSIYFCWLLACLFWLYYTYSQGIALFFFALIILSLLTILLILQRGPRRWRGDENYRRIPYYNAKPIITTLLDSLSDFGEVEMNLRGSHDQLSFCKEYDFVMTIHLNEATYNFRNDRLSEQWLFLFSFKKQKTRIYHREAISKIKKIVFILIHNQMLEMTINGCQSPKAFRDEWKEVTIRLDGATYIFRPKPKS